MHRLFLHCCDRWPVVREAADLALEEPPVQPLSAGYVFDIHFNFMQSLLTTLRADVHIRVSYCSSSGVYVVLYGWLDVTDGSQGGRKVCSRVGTPSASDECSRSDPFCREGVHRLGQRLYEAGQEMCSGARSPRRK